MAECNVSVRIHVVDDVLIDNDLYATRASQQAWLRSRPRGRPTERLATPTRHSTRVATQNCLGQREHVRTASRMRARTDDTAI